MRPAIRSAIVWLAVLGLFAGVIVLAVNLADTEPRRSASPLIDQPAPSFTLPSLDGRGVISTQAYAGEIQIINFFASWCLECKLEHPALLAAANTLKDEARFIGVTYLDTPEDANAFLDENGRADGGAYAFDENGFASIEYGLFGIPETFFVDEDGIVVAKITGPATLALILSIVDDIRAGNETGVTKTGETQSSPTD